MSNPYLDIAQGRVPSSATTTTTTPPMGVMPSAPNPYAQLATGPLESAPPLDDGPQDSMLGRALRNVAELPMGLALGAGRVGGTLVEGLGKATETIADKFDQNPDERNFNHFEQSGRKLQRWGQAVRENADLVEMQTLTGKAAKFVGVLGTTGLAIAATRRALPLAPTSTVGKAAAMALAAVPVTAAQTVSREGLALPLAEMIGAEELAKTFEGNLGLNIMADIGLDATVGVMADLGFAKIAALRAAAKAKAAGPIPVPTAGDVVLGPAQALLPSGVPRATAGPDVLGPAIPMRGAYDAYDEAANPIRALLRNPDPRPTAGDVPLGPAIPMRGELPPTEIERLLVRAAAQAPPVSPLAQGVERFPTYDARPLRIRNERMLDEEIGNTSVELSARRTRSQSVDEEAAEVLRAAKAAGEAERRAGGVVLHSMLLPIDLDLIKTEAGKRVLTSGGLIGTGLTMQQSEDERLRATGKDMVAWGTLALLYPSLKAAGIKGGTAARQALMQSPDGVKLLNYMSYDFTVSPELKVLTDRLQQGMAETQAIQNRMLQEVTEVDGGPITLRDEIFRPTATKARVAANASTQRRISDLIEEETFEPVMGEDSPAVLALVENIRQQYEKLGELMVEHGTMAEKQFAKYRGRFAGKRIYPEHLVEEAVEGGQASRSLRTSAQKSRKDLSDATRNEMGEVREIGMRIRMSYGQRRDEALIMKFFNDLEQIPGQVLPESAAASRAYRAAKDALEEFTATTPRPTDPDALLDYQETISALRVQASNAKRQLAGIADEYRKPMAGYVRLPDTPGLGPLRNTVVKQEVAEYVAQLPAFSDPGKWRAYLRGLSAWKFSKTVLNTGTHVGNTASNVVVSHLGGLPIGPEQVKYLNLARKAWKEYDKDVQFLAEQGVLGRGLPSQKSDFTRNSLEDNLKYLHDITRPATREVLSDLGVSRQAWLKRFATKALQRSEDLYAMEDGLFRVAMFKKKVADGMPAEEAAAYVLKQYADYSTRSPILRGISQTVSPFIMFTAKMLPRAVDQILTHPHRWLSLMVLWGGLDRASRAEVGPINFMDLPENERERSYFMPGVIQLPFKDDRGRPASINLTRWTPFSALTGDAAPGTLAGKMSPEFPAVLTPSGPLSDIATRIFSGNDPFTGKPLVEDWMGPQMLVGALAQQIVQIVAPTMLGVHLPRVLEDIENLDYRAAVVNATGFAGMKPRMITPGAVAASQYYDFNRDLASLQRFYRNKIRDAVENPAKVARLQEDYKEAMLRRVRRFNEAREVYDNQSKSLQERNAMSGPGVSYTPR